MTDYVLLKRAPQVVPVADIHSFGFSALNLPMAPSIETLDLAPRAVVEAFRRPEVLAIAPVMPTRLIAQVASAEADAEANGVSWGIGAVGAIDSTYTGAGVTVAVLDTGIDAGHPAFAGVEIVQRDFSGDGDGDVLGHGTHCAGTILGRDVGGWRIGVARGVERLLVGKVLGNDGGGDSAMLFDGIQWAIENGADVISMSLGFDFPGMVARWIEQGYPPEAATSAALEGYRANLHMFDSLMGMVRAGAPFGRDPVVIAAAGNESMRPQYEIAASLPAAAFDVVSVAALSQAGAGYSVAPFSNNSAVLSGPGVEIVSARVGGGLIAYSGTSMACPHVAGVAALWCEYLASRNLTPSGANVQSKLRASARFDAIVDGDEASAGLGIASAP